MKPLRRRPKQLRITHIIRNCSNTPTLQIKHTNPSTLNQPIILPILPRKKHTIPFTPRKLLSRSRKPTIIPQKQHLITQILHLNPPPLFPIQLIHLKLHRPLAHKTIKILIKLIILIILLHIILRPNAQILINHKQLPITLH
ncbi:hypothetical protein HanPI659440_Chr15g0592471 [Helianthus annuus]|nr:hypothetical protein HanPI659440_Chr15g0592471 [Helianthus annuus]